MTKKNITGLIAVYLVGAFLSFGWYYNQHEDMVCDQENYWTCKNHNANRNMSSLVVGISWFIYWPGRVAIWITK